MTVRAQAPARCQTCGTPLLPGDTDGYCWADAPFRPTPGSVLAERVERVLVALERVDFFSEVDAAVREAVVAVHELRLGWKESPQRRALLDELRHAA